jgi:hypothetical protein
MADDIEHAEWEPHTCAHPPEVDTCAGCKQREDMHLQPVSQRLRDDQVRRELVADVRYTPFVAEGMWLAACERCGAVVVSGRSNSRLQVGEVATTQTHTDWHVRVNQAIAGLGRGPIL